SDIAGHELEGVEFNPKPTQEPHPPIWIGGRTEVGARRAARFGDAWHPSHMTLTELAGARAQLTELCEAEGRPPDEVELTTRRRVAPAASGQPSGLALEGSRLLEGDGARMREELEAMEATG